MPYDLDSMYRGTVNGIALGKVLGLLALIPLAIFYLITVYVVVFAFKGAQGAYGQMTRLKAPGRSDDLWETIAIVTIYVVKAITESTVAFTVNGFQGICGLDPLELLGMSRGGQAPTHTESE